PEREREERSRTRAGPGEIRSLPARGGAEAADEPAVLLARLPHPRERALRAEIAELGRVDAAHERSGEHARRLRAEALRAESLEVGLLHAGSGRLPAPEHLRAHAQPPAGGEDAGREEGRRRSRESPQPTAEEEEALLRSGRGDDQP